MDVGAAIATLLRGYFESNFKFAAYGKNRTVFLIASDRLSSALNYATTKL